MHRLLDNDGYHRLATRSSYAERTKDSARQSLITTFFRSTWSLIRYYFSRLLYYKRKYTFTRTGRLWHGDNPIFSCPHFCIQDICLLIVFMLTHKALTSMPDWIIVKSNHLVWRRHMKGRGSRSLGSWSSLHSNPSSHQVVHCSGAPSWHGQSINQEHNLAWNEVELTTYCHRRGRIIWGLSVYSCW